MKTSESAQTKLAAVAPGMADAGARTGKADSKTGKDSKHRSQASTGAKTKAA
jgi:hypothetical protein